MNYEDTEASVDEGSPQELYLWAQGGNTWPQTASDSTVSFAGFSYLKQTISRSELEHTEESNSGSLQIGLQVDNPVAQRWLGVTPAIPMYLTVRRLHRNGTNGIKFQGRVMRASYEHGEVMLHCVPDEGTLDRRIPILTDQTQCPLALYDDQCLVNPASFTVIATLTAVSDVTLTATAFGTKPDGWFNAGVVILTTGDYNGDRRFVRTHVGTVITLDYAFRSVGIGSVVKALAGCDRTRATCISKFNNLGRHWGVDTIPNRNPYKGRMV